VRRPGGDGPSLSSINWGTKENSVLLFPLAGVVLHSFSSDEDVVRPGREDNSITSLMKSLNPLSCKTKSPSAPPKRNATNNNPTKNHEGRERRAGLLVSYRCKGVGVTNWLLFRSMDKDGKCDVNNRAVSQAPYQSRAYPLSGAGLSGLTKDRGFQQSLLRNSDKSYGAKQNQSWRHKTFRRVQQRDWRAGCTTFNWPRYYFNP